MVDSCVTIIEATATNRHKAIIWGREGEGWKGGRVEREGGGGVERGRVEGRPEPIMLKI